MLNQMDTPDPLRMIERMEIRDMSKIKHRYEEEIMRLLDKLFDILAAFFVTKEIDSLDEVIK